jgi:acyl phosphate:glycerol-3-phosphate acyltransferase
MSTDSFFIFALPLAAYLLGSIPWGLVLTRLSGAADVRRHGSGNIGATNVARVAGPLLGLATLGGDVFKGWLPVALASRLDVPPAAAAPYAVALALLAVLGHMFPVYTRWRGGGKGVATTAGGFFALVPMAVLIAAGVFGLIMVLTRRVSAGSLAAAAALPIAVLSITGSAVSCIGAAIAAVLIFVRHADNIRRLRAGTEPTFRFGVKSGR